MLKLMKKKIYAKVKENKDNIVGIFINSGLYKRMKNGRDDIIVRTDDRLSKLEDKPILVTMGYGIHTVTTSIKLCAINYMHGIKYEKQWDAIEDVA